MELIEQLLNAPLIRPVLFDFRRDERDELVVRDGARRRVIATARLGCLLSRWRRFRTAPIFGDGRSLCRLLRGARCVRRDGGADVYAVEQHHRAHHHGGDALHQLLIADGGPAAAIKGGGDRLQLLVQKFIHICILSA